MEGAARLARVTLVRVCTTLHLFQDVSMKLILCNTITTTKNANVNENHPQVGIYHFLSWPQPDDLAGIVDVGLLIIISNDYCR